MQRSTIAGLTSSLIPGVLFIVVGIAAGSGSGADLAAWPVYLVGSWMIFAVTAHRASGGEGDRMWAAPLGVAVIGPSIPTLISLVASEATEPIAVQVSQILLLLWLPAVVGAFAGALVAALNHSLRLSRCLRDASREVV